MDTAPEEPRSPGAFSFILHALYLFIFDEGIELSGLV